MKIEDLILKYCEPPTTIEVTFWRKYRITTPDGSLEYSKRKGFRNVAGGNGTCRSFLLMSVELWGTPRVNGPPEFVAACVAQAHSLRIPILPEAGDEHAAGCFIALTMFFSFFVFVLTAWMVLPNSVPAWADWLIGVSAAALANVLFGRAIKRACERDRRRRGAAAYLNPFPDLHERTSAREIAKRKGLL
jgi:hypothetical protein